MAKTTARKASDYIIRFSHEHGDLVTNLKLQKLLYYAQAWHLVFYDEPLFNERFEAWVHGPVQPDVYRDFKQFGWNPITYDPGDIRLDETIKRHLDEVMEVYGGISSYNLERLTHQEDPWKNARRGIPKDEPSNAVISLEDMKQFYTDMANAKNKPA